MVKRTKPVRKTREKLVDKITRAHEESHKLGVQDGIALGHRYYEPARHLHSALSDFVVAVEGLRLGENGVVMINATDLVKFANIGIPARTFVALAGELRRLGYGNPLRLAPYGRSPAMDALGR